MDDIRGSKGSQDQRTPVEAPDSLRSIAYARILDAVGEGEIVGLVNGLQSVFYNETPLTNPDGSFNFANVQVDSRVGTQDQAYIPGFPSVESEIGIGVELTAATAFVRSVTNLDVNRVSVRLSVQTLSKQNTENGDIEGYAVAYAIDVSTDGGAYVTRYTGSFSGKTSTKYERSHSIDLPVATTGWNIRVRRLTADTSASNIQDTTFVEGITEIIDAKLKYPMTALVSTVIDASQFRSVPRRSFHLKGRIVRIPSNYNPTTRVYTGLWDGTFVTGYTNNPAWCFYDLVLNDRYGLGHLVDETRVDKWALYAVSQYCDELVPDGKGGTEPRFTCNLFLQKQADAYKVLKDLASVFRGITFANNDSIVAQSDKPEDPVFCYTNANVEDGKFLYQGSSLSKRYTVALVAWNDMNDFGRKKFVYVEDKVGIARFGVRTVDLTAIGCTSEGQARRLGRWHLFTNRLEADSVGFTVGLEGALVAPGKVVRVADKAKMGRRAGGRIKQVSASFVVVDAPFVTTPAAGDTITVMLPTGVSQTRTITSVTGSNDRVNFSPAFSPAPEVGAVWTVDASDLSAPLYRVMSVRQQDGLKFSISCVRHVPGKHALIEDGTPLETRPTSVLVPSVQLAPTSIALERVQRAGLIVASPMLIARWPATPNAVRYEVQWQRGNGPWSPIQALTGNEFLLENAFPGSYVVRVKAVNALGVTSIARKSAPFTLADQTMEPGFIATLEDAIADALTEAENAAAIADGKIDSFYQASPPSTANEGDLWFDTDDGNKIYTRRSGAWVLTQDSGIGNALNAATTAQATADGRVRTYFQTTTPTPVPAAAVGDLWFKTDLSRRLYRFNGSTWVEAADQRVDAVDYARSSLGVLFRDVFDTEYVNANWEIGTGNTGAERVTVASTESENGGSLYRIGNNSGNDYAWLVNSARVPFNPNTLYRIRCRLRRVSGTGTIYVGVTGYAADKTTRVNTSGANSATSQHYVAAAGTSPTNGTWVEYVGYIKGWAASGTGSARPNYTNPGNLQNGVRHMAPLLVANYVDQAGQVEVDYFVLEEADSIALGLDALAAAATAQSTADGKIDSFYQTSPPASASEGDLWFDTDDGNKIYTRRSGAWVLTQDSQIGAAINAASTAQATADGRVRTYFQSTTPTPTPAAGVGDLWYHTTNRALFRFDGSGWGVVSTADLVTDAGGLVKNPDFEAGVDIPPVGWIVNGTATASYVTSGQQSGTRSLRVTASTANSGFMSETPIAVKPGQVLELTAFARQVTMSARLRLRYENAAGAFLSSNEVDTTSTTWRELTVRSVVPANATKVRIALAGGTSVASGTADFDGVNLRRLDPSETSPNLLSNADFTYGLTSWQGGPTVFKDYAEANQLRTGSLAAGVYSFIFQDVELGLVIGGGVDVTAQVEVAPVGWSGAALVQIGIEFLNASFASVGGAVASQRVVGQIADGQFTRISVSGKTPATAYNYLRVVLTSLGPVSALVAWRRPKLERSPVPTFFDPGVDRTFGNELLVIGSGRRVGDQRNLQPLTIGGIRSRWDGLTIGYSATADAPSTVTVSVSAATLRAGSATISYNASTFVTSQVRNTTVRRQLYYLDPTYAGGSRTLNATTNANNLADRDDVVWVGEVTTIVPASGGSGGGGDPGGGCVDAIMWVDEYRQARDVQLGETLDCPVYADSPWLMANAVRQNHSTVQPCHRLVTESGAAVVASDSTPMTLRDGSTTYVPGMLDLEVLVESDGLLVWEKVVECYPVGLRPVVAFNVGDTCYMAGERSDRRIATHNILIKP